MTAPSLTDECDVCGRTVFVRNDGSLRRHRTPEGFLCQLESAESEMGTADPHQVTLSALVSRRLRRAAERCDVTVQQAVLDALNSYCTDVELTTSQRPRSASKGGWVVPLSEESA